MNHLSNRHLRLRISRSHRPHNFGALRFTNVICHDISLPIGCLQAAFDYRLGNRSALEWVIDQYRVSTDPRSGIVNDPNREDDPKYILRLIGQVITVSLETQQIIADLPSLGLPA
jgi:predicted helicase